MGSSEVVTSALHLGASRVSEGSFWEVVSVLKTRLRAWLSPAALGVFVACAALQVSPVWANDDIAKLSEGDKQRLLNQLQSANVAFDAGQWREALAGYDAAILILESSSIQYRRGLCLEKLERYEDAIDAYERFLVLDPAAPEGGRVRADIERLQGIVERLRRSLLTVNTVPSGADVRLDAADGPLLGRTPLLEVRVEPGEHTLHITKEGYQPLQERVDAQPGKTLVVSYPLQEEVSDEARVQITSTPAGAVVKLAGGRVAGRTPLTLTLPSGAAELTLEAEGYLPRSERYTLKAGQELAVTFSLEKVPVIADPGPPPRPAGVSKQAGWGWGLTITGLVLGVGSAGLGYLTESTIQEANDYGRQTPGHSREALSELERDAQLYRIGTWVTGGLGGASLLVGGVLLITTLFDDEGAGALRLGPSPDGAHMEWVWAF